MKVESGPEQVGPSIPYVSADSENHQIDENWSLPFLWSWLRCIFKKRTGFRKESSYNLPAQSGMLSLSAASLCSVASLLMFVALREPVISSSYYRKAEVLSQRWFPPGDICQCLETLLVVTVGSPRCSYLFSDQKKKKFIPVIFKQDYSSEMLWTPPLPYWMEIFSGDPRHLWFSIKLYPVWGDLCHIFSLGAFVPTLCL